MKLRSGRTKVEKVLMKLTVMSDGRTYQHTDGRTKYSVQIASHTFKKFMKSEAHKHNIMIFDVKHAASCQITNFLVL